MKNPDKHIGNRARGLTACITVSRPTVPPRALKDFMIFIWMSVKFKFLPKFVPGSSFLQRNDKCWSFSSVNTDRILKWLWNSWSANLNPRDCYWWRTFKKRVCVKNPNFMIRTEIYYKRIIPSTNFNSQFSLFINNMFFTLLSSTCFEH